MYPMIGHAAKAARTMVRNAGAPKTQTRSGWHWTNLANKATEKSIPPPNDTTYTTPLLLKAITTKLGHIPRIIRRAIPLQALPAKNTYHTQTDRAPLLMPDSHEILRQEAQSVGTSIPELLRLLSCPEKTLPITTEYVHGLVNRLKTSIPGPDISAKHRTTNPVRDIAQGLFRQNQNGQPRPIDRNEMVSYLRRELLLSPGKTELGSLIGVPKQGSSLKEKNPELYCMMKQMADTDANLENLCTEFQMSPDKVKALFKQKEIAVLVANAPHPNPYGLRFLDLYTQLTDAGLKLTPAFFGTVDQGYLELNKGKNMSIELECQQYAETMVLMLKHNPNMPFDLYLSGATAPVYDEVDANILHQRTLEYAERLAQHLKGIGITLLPEQLNIIAGDTHGQANHQNITDLHHLLKENGFKLARYHNHLNPFATDDNDIEQDWVRIIHNQLRCMELGIATDHTAGTGQGNPAKGDTDRKNANIPPSLPTLLALLSDTISIDGTDAIEQKKRALILDLFRTHTIPSPPCQHDLFLKEMGPELLLKALETYQTITTP